MQALMRLYWITAVDGQEDYRAGPILPQAGVTVPGDMRLRITGAALRTPVEVFHGRKKGH
jgi:hypothetical protein